MAKKEEEVKERDEDPEGEVPRAAKIGKEWYVKFGYSENCDGCNKMRAGLRIRMHSKACRERMEKNLEEDAKGKLILEKGV